MRESNNERDTSWFDRSMPPSVTHDSSKTFVAVAFGGHFRPSRRDGWVTTNSPRSGNEEDKNMKRILLAIVTVTALTSVSALAADLTARMPVKAALVQVPYNWTGTYMGLNLGGAFGSFKGSS